MTNSTINDIHITTTGNVSEAEIVNCLERLQAKSKYKIISVDIVADGECLNVSYETENVPFERIRRITGYLVGSTARFCNSKRAEEKDRVKHGFV